MMVTAMLSAMHQLFMTVSQFVSLEKSSRQSALNWYQKKKMGLTFIIFTFIEAYKINIYSRRLGCLAIMVQV